MTRRLLVTLSSALVAVALAAPAHANPKAFPFTYGTNTMPKGHLELEQYIDTVPVRAARELPDGSLEGVLTPRYELQTEFEYGVNDWMDVGFYVVFRQGASADTPFLRFQGTKQRVRLRFADPGAWPVDVGAYLEVAEYHDEIELEEKLLLQHRQGPLLFAANLWVEQEYYFIVDEWKFLYNPSIAASVELDPHVTLGLEYWARGRFDTGYQSGASDDDATPAGARHYVGPTVLLQSGEYWLSLGAYLRVDGLGEPTAVGDGFGRVWVRAIVGLGL